MQNQINKMPKNSLKKDNIALDFTNINSSAKSPRPAQNIDLIAQSNNLLPTEIT